jgi:hypothetical protein
MEGRDNVTAGPLRDIEALLEVEFPFLEKTILLVSTGKKRGFLIDDLEGGEDKGVRGGGQGDLIREENIDGVGKEVVGKECKLQVVVSGVDIVMVGKGVSGTHLSPQGVMEMQVEVLQEQVLVCLAVRRLMWLTEIREILVARQDRDDVGSSVEVMLPFLQGVDNSQ